MSLVTNSLGDRHTRTCEHSHIPLLTLQKEAILRNQMCTRLWLALTWFLLLVNLVSVFACVHCQVCNYSCEISKKLEWPVKQVINFILFKNYYIAETNIKIINYIVKIRIKTHNHFVHVALYKKLHWNGSSWNWNKTSYWIHYNFWKGFLVQEEA